MRWIGEIVRDDPRLQKRLGVVGINALVDTAETLLLILPIVGAILLVTRL